VFLCSGSSRYQHVRAGDVIHPAPGNSMFVYDPLRTPNGIGCDIQMPPTAKVLYCTMVSPIL
jgi:hypothetical protein